MAQATPPAATRAGVVAAPTLDALLSTFRDVAGMECSFREEKQIALLSRPLVSEGRLYYARPGRLARYVTEPVQQTVLVVDGELRMRTSRGTETIQLESQPVVRSFVDTFGQLFSGERAALERTYSSDYTVDGGNWRLRLRPRSAPLNLFLTEIVFEGSGANLERMSMVEVSGDRTMTTFQNVDTERRFSRDELETLFRLAH